MKSENEIAASEPFGARKSRLEPLTSLFPFISPEFVPLLLLIAVVGFAIQIIHAVLHGGWLGIFIDPSSALWVAVWFFTCCGIYTKLIAPHLQRTHQNLGMLIHVSCLYTFFSASFACLQFALQTIL